MRTGHALKIEGMAAVGAVNVDWGVFVRDALTAWQPFAPAVFAIEDFRAWLDSRHPHIRPTKPNAWGGISAALQKEGVIEAVGLRAANSPRTHAHRVLTYRFKRNAMGIDTMIAALSDRADAMNPDDAAFVRHLHGAMNSGQVFRMTDSQLERLEQMHSAACGVAAC